MSNIKKFLVPKDLGMFRTLWLLLEDDDSYHVYVFDNGEAIEKYAFSSEEQAKEFFETFAEV